jgi:guanyl-specific ribonuclease Sa
MRRIVWISVALFALGLWLWAQPRAPGAGTIDPGATTPATAAPIAPPVLLPGDRPAPPATRYPAFLPREAHTVLDRIAQGGPYDYRQDGGVFHNRERLLPARPRGYYREFTVETPGSPDRGPRRIVTGGQPPFEYWYTDDHYRSFQRFEVSP